MESHSYDLLDTLLSTATRSGYSARQILEQAMDEIVVDTTLSDKHKLQIGYQSALIEKALLDGANEELQLRSFFSFILALTYKL